MNQQKNDCIQQRILLIVGIIFLAFNLRPAITSVGPLIATIQENLGINNLKAGFITTIPLIAFAVFSPFVAKISQRWGNERTLFFSLLALLAGILVRYSHNLWIFYFGTLIIGSGIAFLNVLLPSIIKADFPKRIGLMTSVYTTAMCSMAGLASGVSVPLADGVGLGWEKALAIWGFLALIGLLLWIPQLRNRHQPATVKPETPPVSSIWKSSTAWAVSIFFGFQSFIFYSVVAWLPAILLHKGMNEQTAGWMLLFVQIIGLPATFLSPIIALKLKRMWMSVAVIGLINLLGFAGLIIFHQTSLLISSIALIGLSTGGSISLAYLIISLKSEDPKQATQLSGMAQAAGYFLAAIGPVFLGFTYDYTGLWIYPILIIHLANLLMLSFGICSVLPKARV